MKYEYIGNILGDWGMAEIACYVDAKWNETRSYVQEPQTGFKGSLSMSFKSLLIGLPWGSYENNSAIFHLKK